MGEYAFLNNDKKKILGAFNPPIKIANTTSGQFPLVEAEKPTMELGLPTHYTDATSYELEVYNDIIGTIIGKGAKWSYTTAQGEKSDTTYKSRKLATYALTERYLGADL
jgi:hypothetical protein